MRVLAFRNYRSLIKYITRSKEASSPFYKRRFKYTLIFLLTATNYVLTYVHRFDLAHLYYFLSDLIAVFVVIQFYLICINVLDNLLPWSKNVKKRLLIQLTIVSLVVAIFNILVNETFDAIDGSGRIDIGFYSFDMLVALVLIMTVQFIYIALHFIYEKPYADSLEISTERFKVTYGKTSKIFTEEEILAAFVTSDITYILDKNCQRYIFDLPLKELEEKLSTRFFRANRQFIISKDMIDGYKSLDFGKIEVNLSCQEGNIPGEIIVSRKKASQFRKWVNS